MRFWLCPAHEIIYIFATDEKNIWRVVAAFIVTMGAFNTVQGSGMPNLRTKFESRCWPFFRLSPLFIASLADGLMAHPHTTHTGQSSFSRGFKCRVFLVM